MTEPQHGEHHPTTAAHWEERYSGEQVWSGNPNQALVAEVAGLPVGRALDLGCGEGADSVWLAEQGWDVTALDISANAVRHTTAAAQARGLSVTGVVSAFLDAELPDRSFDLVSAMYPVLARTPDQLAERRLMSLVAPGGTLLFVHHADVDRQHALEHGFDPDEFLSPDDVAAALTDDFEVQVQDRRARDVVAGAGAGHTHDLVLRARRR